MSPVTIIAPSQETELFLNNRWTFTKPIDEKKINCILCHHQCILVQKTKNEVRQFGVNWFTILYVKFQQKSHIIMSILG